jgi:SAM-dependent MidA family methyltransferase
MPGDVDLSAYVDFAAVKNVTQGFQELQSSKLLPQGLFLEAMGISERIQILIQKNPAKREKLISEYERLASPEHMGEIYKVLFIGNKSLGNIYPFGEDLVFEKAEN